MANESQDDLISAADVASPIQLQQDEQPKSRFQKISEGLRKIFFYVTTFFEATIVLIVFAVIMYYLVRGVCLHQELYLNRIYGFVKFISEYWKGALLLFPLLFLKSFLKKLKQLTKASSDGFSFNDHDEFWRA